MSREIVDWDWEAFAVTAFEAYQRGRRTQAMHLWKRSADIAASFAANDPRRAASASNMAIASLLQERYDEAVAGFSEAAARWDGVLSWIERMEVEPVGRSSNFHLRMAQRHQDAFAEARRSRWQQSLSGAQALTKFNQALALFFVDEDVEADRLLLQALAQRQSACGAGNPELALISGVLAGRQASIGNETEARKLEAEVTTADAARGALQCWKDEQPMNMNDSRRLLAATCLTAMIHERDFL